MKRRVNIIGVGMIPFTAPNGAGNAIELAAEAGRIALADAGSVGGEVQRVYVQRTSGVDRSAASFTEAIGLTAATLVEVPADAEITDLLYLASRSIELGETECVLVIGSGPAVQEGGEQARMHQAIGDAMDYHVRRYGTRREAFAMVALKAREHAARNPFARFGEPVTLEQVMAAEPWSGPLTRLECCSFARGSAAVVLCSDAYVLRQGISKPVHIFAQARVDRPQGEITCSPELQAVGYDLNVTAAVQVYQEAGMGPDEIDVCELHDSDAASEILLYEALGFCREGDAERFVEDGDNTYGGNLPVNPSGGFLGRGDSFTASPLAQCVELVWQLRGSAAGRQVERARVALQHRMERGGASLVTLYRKD